MQGTTTKWHTLWRSDSPHKLGPEEQQQLCELGIEVVIDLRFDDEVQRGQSPFSERRGVSYHNVPMLKPPPNAGLPPPGYSLKEVYRSIVERHKHELAQVVKILLATDKPVLIHCTAGKDRTGVTIALLLSAVGVHQEVLLEDYNLTEKCIEPILPHLRAHMNRYPGLEPDFCERMLAVSPEAMETAFAFIKEEYGGTKEYFLALGFTEEEIGRLRVKLVD